jgi:PAS domain S-box-containing protein
MPEGNYRFLFITDKPEDFLITAPQKHAQPPDWRAGLVIARQLKAGLQLLKDQSFDAILLDLNLPDSQGVETFNRLHNQFHDHPVVVISGAADDGLADQVIQKGAQDFLIIERTDDQQIERSLRFAVERHKYQKSLPTFEQRYKAMLEQSGDAISLLSANGTLLYAGPATTRILGYNPEEQVGRSGLDYIHPGDAILYLEGFSQVLKHPLTPIATQFRCRHKAGHWCWIEATATNLLNEPTVQAIVVNYRNIDERKNNEQALSESEERFRAIFEQAPVGVALVDVYTGRFIRVNPKYCDITGYSCSEMLAKRFQDITHPDDLQNDLSNMAQLVAGTTRTFTGEKRYIHKDGTTIWTNLTVSAMWAEGQAPNYNIAIIEGINGRKQAEQALHEREIQYRTVIETSPDGFWMSDRNGILLEVNNTYLQRSGYSRAELIGKPISMLEDHEQPEEVAAHMAKIVRDGNDLFESRHRTKDGQTWLVEVNVAFSSTAGGQFYAFLRDIQRRRRSDNLLRIRQQLSDLALHGSLDELLQRTLDAAEQLTGSGMAFFALTSGDAEGPMTIETWSTNTEKTCVKMSIDRHASTTEAGVWADCLKTRAPVIHNDYPALPEKKGLPPGHIPLVRELVVPILQDGRVTAVVNVGNKPADYTQEDVEIVQTLASLVMDVVERKKVEEALRESEEKFRKAFFTSPDAIIISRLSDGKMVSVNDGFEILSGYVAPEVIGRSSMDINLWVDREDRDQLIRILVEKGMLQNLEARLRRKNGEVRSGLVSAIQIDLNGIAHMLTITHDITERKQDEDGLRKRTEELDLLLEASRELNHTLI